MDEGFLEPRDRARGRRLRSAPGLAAGRGLELHGKAAAPADGAQLTAPAEDTAAPLYVLLYTYIILYSSFLL